MENARQRYLIFRNEAINFCLNWQFVSLPLGKAHEPHFQIPIDHYPLHASEKNPFDLKKFSKI